MFIIYRITYKPQKNARLCHLVGILLGFIPAIQSQLIPFIIIYLIVFFYLHPHFPFIAVAKSMGLVSAPQLFLILGSSVPFKFGFFWQPLTDEGIFFGPFIAWCSAIGLFPILSLTLPWFFLDRRQRNFFTASLTVFFLGNIIVLDDRHRLIFQVLYPFWISVAVPSVLLSLHRLYNTPQDEQLQGVLAAFSLVFVIAMSLSSILGIRHQLSLSDDIWDISFEDAGEWILKSTQLDDIFVSYKSHFEIASTFAGRAVYTTDTASQRAVEVALLFANPNNTELIPQARYLIDSKTFSLTPFANASIKIWRQVYRNSEISIYKRQS
jgi:hypothetical protein